MSGKIEARLAELGITLPDAPAPAANYVPYVISGNLVYVSGQISMGPEGLIKGLLGGGMSVEGGVAAARVCGLNLLAQVRAACDGDLDRVSRVVRLGGFVASTPDFFDQPVIINGASDLIAEVFEQRGRHTRSALGVHDMPLDAAVQLSFWAEARPD